MGKNTVKFLSPGHDSTAIPIAFAKVVKGFGFTSMKGIFSHKDTHFLCAIKINDVNIYKL